MVCAVEIHFVDEEKRGDVIALQKPPQRTRVALHTVCAADDEHSVIEHLKRALHFAGKIDVTGGIEQRKRGMFER